MRKKISQTSVWFDEMEAGRWCRYGEDWWTMDEDNMVCSMFYSYPARPHWYIIYLFPCRLRLLLSCYHWLSHTVNYIRYATGCCFLNRFSRPMLHFCHSSTPQLSSPPPQWINTLTYLPSGDIPNPFIFPQGLRMRPHMTKGPIPTQPTDRKPNAASCCPQVLLHSYPRPSPGIYGWSTEMRYPGDRFIFIRPKPRGGCGILGRVFLRAILGGRFMHEGKWKSWYVLWSVAILYDHWCSLGLFLCRSFWPLSLPSTYCGDFKTRITIHHYHCRRHRYADILGHGSLLFHQSGACIFRHHSFHVRSFELRERSLDPSYPRCAVSVTTLQSARYNFYFQSIPNGWSSQDLNLTVTDD